VPGGHDFFVISILTKVISS